MSDFTVVNVGGMKYVEDSTKTWISLNGSNAQTTGITLHDMEGNADYQVTAGKTFTIVAMLVTHSSASRTITVFQADAADGTTGETDVIVFNSNTTGTDTLYIFPNEPTIAASKYVNWKVSNATTPPLITQLIGYES